MRGVLFGATMRARMRALLWWTVALVLLASMYIALFPSLRDQSSINDLLKTYPDAVKQAFGISDFTSPSGYLNAELFSFLMPLVLGIYSIGQATDAIAGEEERKTIDLLVSHPVTRRRIVLEKFAALLTGLVVICVATFAVITLLGPPFSVDLPLSRVAGAVGGQFLLAAALGSFALFLACVTGKRGISRALSGLVGLLAFLLNSAAPSIDALRPYRSASLLYHAVGIDPLRNGVDPVNVAVPLGVAVVLTIAAVLVFQRRDIAV